MGNGILKYIPKDSLMDNEMITQETFDKHNTLQTMYVFVSPSMYEEFKKVGITENICKLEKTNEEINIP